MFAIEDSGHQTVQTGPSARLRMDPEVGQW